ncbi:MAG: hypothetical protein OEX19_15270 [Gammaproteobacteria bacterium]|nr:hypothetical protein [Gammaproteobacteria bacterium]
MLCIVAFAREGVPQKLSDTLPESGRELYRIFCAARHGSDGRGAPASMVGFNTPFGSFI